jgi:nucleoside-diphosphate-sugar epimerase
MATTSAKETFTGEPQINKLDMLYLGTKNVINQCGPSLENVLFTSSGVTYGINNKNKISEDDFSAPNTCDPGSALALGKLVSEYFVNYFSKILNYNYSIARCFAFCGQHLPTELHYAFGNFIQDAEQGKDIIIQSDGKTRRSYMYVGDAVAWLLRLLSEPKNKIYNVGSENDLSIYDLATKIALKFNPSIKIYKQNTNTNNGNFNRSSYTPSTHKIRTDYPNLREWTTLDESIEKMMVKEIEI